MEIKIQSIHCQPDDLLLENISMRLGKINKIYSRIQHADVTLKYNRDSRNKNYCVEINLSVPGQSLFASEHDESFGQALNKVITELKKQIAKYKSHLNVIDSEEVTIEEG